MRPANNNVDGKVHVRKEPLMVFTLIFLMLLQLFINRSAVLQRKEMEITTLLPLAAGQFFCHVSDLLTASFPVFNHTQPMEPFAQWVSILFGHFIAAYK
jgi:hypothetical protein